MDKKDDFLFTEEYSKILPEVSVVIEKFGIVLPSGHLLNRCTLNEKQFNIPPRIRGKILSYIRSMLSIISIRNLIKYEKAYFITNSNSSNFFHWFLDVLQKLEHLEEVIKKDSSRNFLVLIPANHDTTFMHLSMSAFNIECKWLKKNEIALVKNIAVIPDIAPTGNYHQRTINKLSERLRIYFKKYENNKNSYSKIYITRKNAKKRKIINEEDLLPILIEFGFTIVDFDLLSFSEQVSFIINADVLVSLHGAGLTHMLWMRPKGKVLEIRARDDYQNNCYFSLASDLGYEYNYVLSDKIDSRKTTQLSDFIVNKKHFRDKITNMLSVILV
jgi:capsular polysaccharide biosynthesis protein